MFVLICGIVRQERVLGTRPSRAFLSAAESMNTSRTPVVTGILRRIHFTQRPARVIFNLLAPLSALAGTLMLIW